MARNEEVSSLSNTITSIFFVLLFLLNLFLFQKANALLNRFHAMKAEERKLLEPETRPFDINDCSDIAQAQHWREEVILDISKKLIIIQQGFPSNSSSVYSLPEYLGEHKIRELNDNINTLLLEKYNWEKRILELGGANLLTSPDPPPYQFVILPLTLLWLFA